MPATNYLLDLILEEEFGAVAHAAVATMYFGLSTETFTKTTTTPTGEPTGLGGYARVSFTNDQTNWGDASTGILVNDVAVTFPECTEATGWGTILTVFIADSVTVGAGNTLWYYTLSPSFSVPDGLVVSFPASSITVTFS